MEQIRTDEQALMAAVEVIKAYAGGNPTSLAFPQFLEDLYRKIKELMADRD